MGGWCYCLDTYQKGGLEGCGKCECPWPVAAERTCRRHRWLAVSREYPAVRAGKKVGVLNGAVLNGAKLSDEDLRLLNTVGDLMKQCNRTRTPIRKKC